jgi:hypothetical protein
MMSYQGRWSHGKKSVAAGRLRGGKAKVREIGATYNSQLLIDLAQLGLVARVRPAAHEDLVPPFDPALRRRLPEVDLLSFVPAGVGVEKNSGGEETSESVGHRQRKGTGRQPRRQGNLGGKSKAKSKKRTASARPWPARRARPWRTAP